MSSTLSKKSAPGEARTHGLQIMRLTRCLLRYGGSTSTSLCQSLLSQWMRLQKNEKEFALAGNRTRVNCLEGSYAHHYTTNAYPFSWLTFQVVTHKTVPKSPSGPPLYSLYDGLRGAMVARLTPDQKAACSSHVGVSILLN